MLHTWLERIARLFYLTPAEITVSRAFPWHGLALVAVTLAGAVVRFTELGAIGLHGDEETMGLAVRHILEDGTPYLPSGMFYPRGLAQLYLMAASVQIFGETEWALRLPSVLCGIALIPLAYWLARRFLAPGFAVLMAACAAFLPEFIEYSQTARMYIFMITGLTVFMIFVNRWEMRGQTGSLVAAVLALLVSVHFHSLSILAAVLLVYPGLLRGDLHRLLAGAAALVAAAVGFVLIDGWVEGKYPDLPERATAVDGLREGRRAGAMLLDDGSLLWNIGAAAFAIVLAMWVASRVREPLLRGMAATLIVLGLLAQAMSSYHIAGLLLIIGVVMSWPVMADHPGRMSPHAHEAHAALRTDWRGLLPIMALVAICAVMAAWQVTSLKAAGVDTTTRLFGALSGVPSVWPYVRLGSFSWMTALLVAGGLAMVLWEWAHRRPVRDYWLFFLAACLAPLLIVGVARWNVPERYVSGCVIPFMLTGLCVLQDAAASLHKRFVAYGTTWAGGRGMVLRSVPALAAVLITALVVNPLKFREQVNAGYAHHPDHKGAAEFLRTLQLDDDDLLLAEDVLQQTYYLGRVDYWLISDDFARLFTEEIAGEPLDIYTHTKIMATAERLRQVSAAAPGDVYVIGSGENQGDGRRGMRGDGLHDILESAAVETLYEGRDGTTRVWRIRKQELARLFSESPRLPDGPGTNPATFSAR